MKLIIALILLLLITSGQAKTLTVDPGGSGDAKTIHDAIFLASSGDAIQILPGNYGGALVNRSLSISGKGDVILGGPLVVTAPGCEISDLTVKVGGQDPAVSLLSGDNRLIRCTISGAANALRSTGENNSIRETQIDSPLGSGLEIYGAENKVQNCTIQGNVGIRINKTRESLISGCRIEALQGVLIEDSSQNIVENNTFSADGFGVVLTRSEGNELSMNNISGIYVSGLDVSNSRRNNLTRNIMTGGKIGISLRGAEHCNVTENVCSKNERAGIYGDKDSLNIVAGNELSGNGNGILLSGSSGNRLESNSISQNTYGISLRGSTENILRENSLQENNYNLRVETGEGTDSASSHDFYVQDIDETNLVDNKSICYLVGKSNLTVPSDCGFLGLISCRDVAARNLTIHNSSTGVLLVNSTNCRIQESSVSRAENGFSLLDSKACTIRGCSVRDCTIGFAAKGSTGLQFVNNLARNCTAEGFRADNALSLLLLKCRSEDSNNGIALHGSRLCRIQNCSTNLNTENGILLTSSQGCSILGNAALSNDRGILLTGSNACALEANNMSLNKRDGISMEQLSDADLLSNIATGNGQGIFIQSSKKLRITGNSLLRNSRFGLRMSSTTGCNITENDISNNQISGVNLVDCSNNLLYHNIFADNSIQNAADNGQNQWDDGPISGGNYWSDHEVSGNPGNVPRQIPGNGQDRYPFQDPGGWS
jgi:parallel beta-helix repeat protein